MIVGPPEADQAAVLMAQPGAALGNCNDPRSWPMAICWTTLTIRFGQTYIDSGCPAALAG